MTQWPFKWMKHTQLSTFCLFYRTSCQSSLTPFHLMFWTPPQDYPHLEFQFRLKNWTIPINFGNLLWGSELWIRVRNNKFSNITEFCIRETNADGRASAFLTWEQFEPGTYKMKFDIKEYFEKKNSETFYPYAEVSWWISFEEIFIVTSNYFRLCLKSKIQNLITMYHFYWVHLATQPTEAVRLDVKNISWK